MEFLGGAKVEALHDQSQNHSKCMYFKVVKSKSFIDKISGVYLGVNQTIAVFTRDSKSINQSDFTDIIIDEIPSCKLL